MEFETRLHGIPCICKITEYYPYVPTHVYGPGMGDADPPEEECILYSILDRNGRPAPWLEKYLTPKDDQRICEEFRQHHTKALYDREPEYS